MATTSKADAAVAVRQPRAIIYGAFRLTADGLQVSGKGEFGDWEAALHAVDYLEEKSPFWKADLFAYAQTRTDWEGVIDAVIDAGQFTKRSVDQYRYVSKAVPAADRMEGLSFSHHEAVAALPSVDKKHFLHKAKREHLSVSELKGEIRKVRHRKILKGQASELAKLEAEASDHAWEASAACRAIMRDDGKQALQQIKIARRALDHCEEAIGKLRKAQGKKS